MLTEADLPSSANSPPGKSVSLKLVSQLFIKGKGVGGGGGGERETAHIYQRSRHREQEQANRFLTAIVNEHIFVEISVSTTQKCKLIIDS